jgi:uncharacterized protein with PQ loop repeat
MALGSTQPLTEMSTRNISWGGGGGVKSRRCLEPYEPLKTCNWIALPFTLQVVIIKLYNEIIV